MRIRMLECLAMPEPSALLQCVFDRRVRVKHSLTIEEFDGVEKVTARSDRRVDLETVLDARHARDRDAWKITDRHRIWFHDHQPL